MISAFYPNTLIIHLNGTRFAIYCREKVVVVEHREKVEYLYDKKNRKLRTNVVLFFLLIINKTISTFFTAFLNFSKAKLFDSILFNVRATLYINFRRFYDILFGDLLSDRIRSYVDKHVS